MASVLVIDDDKAVCDAMKRVLASDGHDVREAPDGRDAMRMMREREAEIVVSDVYMPEVDGIELLHRLHQEFPAARVVIMSGGGHAQVKDLLEIATALGADATLAKPVSPADLRAAIAACMKKGAP